MTDSKVFETTLSDGVCRVFRPGTRWLSTGWNGGEFETPAAYNVTVPDGWPETDLAAYTGTRRRDAGFDDPGPTLLTGVSQDHARRARLGTVEAVVTGGVSNPASLPVDVGTDSDVEPGSPPGDVPTATSPPDTDTDNDNDDASTHPGTVNVLVGTTVSLDPGALPNLVAIAAEAKAATLLAVAGVPGTTSDAIVVGCDPSGQRSQFSGSATAVGRATRACVRDALLASLRSRYDGDGPPTPQEAPYGVVTNERATVTRL